MKRTGMTRPDGVYFLRLGGAISIGWSLNISNTARELERRYGEEAEIIRVIYCGRDDFLERRIRRDLKRFWTGRGKRYRDCEEIEREIAQIDLTKKVFRN